MKLDIKDCNIIKGWSIIAIMLHNYCTWLPNVALENEFTWKQERVVFFLTHFCDNTFVNLFSFMGHYGVVLFVFLSGYGLVMKYEILSKKIIGIKMFILQHFLKLTKILIIGIGLYWSTIYFLHSDIKGGSLLQLIAQLSYTVNMIPMKLLGIYPGPYWYFGMTMELYLVYILLIYNKRIRYLVSICLICLLSLSLSNGHYQIQTWFKLNFTGSIIPFTLGIIYARYNQNCSLYITKIQNLNKIYASLYNKYLKNIYENIRLICTSNSISFYLLYFLIFLTILICEYFFYLWLMISIPIIGLTILSVKQRHTYDNSFIEKIGRNSHILFVIHPIVREIPLANKEDMINHPYYFLLFYLLCSFILVFPVKYILTILDIIQTKLFNLIIYRNHM